MRTRQAPGGGVVVEVPSEQLVPWLNRFAGRNDGLSELTATADSVTARAVDGTTAELAVPFGPMELGEREPVEALLEHLATVQLVGIVLVRAGASSIGVAATTASGTAVTGSSTDRPYVQGRTAAGGWSQQRYARRRGNQRTAAFGGAADTAARLLLPVADSLDALVTGGDTEAVEAVLADRRLAPLVAAVPRRHFGDVPEPRRAVLDETAARSRVVEVTVRTPLQQRSCDVRRSPA